LPSPAPQPESPDLLDARAQRSRRAAIARGFIALFRNVEPDRALRTLATLGRAYARTGLPRVREARINLRIAFPELTPSEREGLLVESFANLGRSIAETALLQGRHRDALFARVRIEGEEHIEAITRRGTGASVVSAQFGSWELCGAALSARGYPLTSVYRPREDPELDELIAGWRADSGMETLSLGGTAAFGLRRALKRGRFVAMLLDQNAARSEGIFAPFFGELASTRSAPAYLAMLFGVPVLPVFFYREPGGAHVARVSPPLELEVEPATSAADSSEASEAVKRNVARINGAIEDAIRRDPAQWMWAHRRYRTRPEGAEPVYPRSRGLLRFLRRHTKRARR
jgi:KDO2-lipid IV(A) lauroyltransferase